MLSAMKIYLVFFASILLCSCKTMMPQEYLTGNKTDTLFSQIHYTRQIQNGDQLAIRIQSMNKEASSIYNIEDGASSGNITFPAFIVDDDGNVLLPQIGTVKATGLSIAELRTVILEKANKFLAGS